MTLKKVCHMTSAHPSEDVRIFQKECVSLAQAGYEVYLVERGESYDKNGVHIIGVGDIPGKRIKRMTVGAKKVYRAALALNCDIYHIHDPELLPYCKKLKSRGKKVIFDSHELTRAQILRKNYLPSFALRLISKLYAAYENRVLKEIDGVIYPCTINGAFPLPGKRQVLLNNVPRLAELYNHYKPDAKKEPNTVCTVGSLTYDRGIKHLVLAAHRAGCKAILAGTVMPSMFETELKQMPESKDAEFLGQINREQVRKVYERSMVGVSSILNVGQYTMAENLPTKVYEFMAMGLPVVLSRNSFNESMIQKYQFGICADPENTDELAAAIKELLDDPERSRELGTNGRKAVRADFNWEKEQKKLLELYDSLLTTETDC